MWQSHTAVWLKVNRGIHRISQRGCNPSILGGRVGVPTNLKPEVRLALGPWAIAGRFDHLGTPRKRRLLQKSQRESKVAPDAAGEQEAYSSNPDPQAGRPYAGTTGLGRAASRGLAV